MHQLRAIFQQAQDGWALASQLLQRMRAQWAIQTALSHAMPPGFEDANATYDPDVDRIYLHPRLLEGDRLTLAFTLLHELRHADQYTHRDQQPPLLSRGLDYVIQYDGLCFKRARETWLSCRLPGTPESWLDLYTNQPHEVDANDGAHALLKEIISADEQPALKELRHFWRPRNGAIAVEEMPGALLAAYREIDRLTATA